MDTLRQRSLTRIVACVDLALSVVGIIASIAIIAVAATEPGDLLGSELRFRMLKSEVDTFQKILIGSLVVSMVICGALSFLDYKLIVATSVNANPMQARKVARIWRIVHIVFAILSLGSFYRGYWWTALINIAIQGVMIFVVHSFIGELNKLLSRPPLPAPMSRVGVGVGGVGLGIPSTISKPPPEPGKAPQWTVET